MTNPHTQHNHCCGGHSHGGIFGEKTELIFAIACGLALLIGWLLSLFPTVHPWIPWSFYVIAYVFGFFFFLR